MILWQAVFVLLKFPLILGVTPVFKGRNGPATRPPTADSQYWCTSGTTYLEYRTFAKKSISSLKTQTMVDCFIACCKNSACNEASYWPEGGLRNCFLFDCQKNSCTRERKRGAVAIGLVRETLTVLNINRRVRRSSDAGFNLLVSSWDTYDELTEVAHNETEHTLF